jgi:hypothetical protein
MGVTWADYTLAEALSNNDGTRLESALATKHGLILALVTQEDPLGVLPEVKIDGVEAVTVGDFGSVPYKTKYNWYYNRYYYNWYGGYSRHYWYNRYARYMPVVSRLYLIVPQAGGSIAVTGIGNNIVEMRVLVFTPHITAGANFTVDRVGFSNSVAAAKVQGEDAYYPVLADDLLVAIGTDSSPNYASASIAYNGPSMQELMTQVTSSGGTSTCVRVWRIKAGGQAKLTYSVCNAGRTAFRLMPNVQERVITPPSPQETRSFFEIQGLVDENGVVTRPTWFPGLYGNQKNATTYGLRRSWVRENENVTMDALGRVTGVNARVIEQWTVVTTAIATVGADALIFTDRAEADARIVMLDNQW